MEGRRTAIIPFSSIFSHDPHSSLATPPRPSTDRATEIDQFRPRPAQDQQRATPRKKY